jgi:hypothetical protein
MCSIPAFPNIYGANGESETPFHSLVLWNQCSKASALSGYLVPPKDPFSIFSKPTAKAQSLIPPLIRL